MPTVNIGQSCLTLAGPTAVTPLGATDSYYSLASATGTKMISVSSDGTIDFSDFGATTGVSGTPNDYLLYLAWSPDVATSASAPVGKPVFLTGDTRLRYIFSASQKVGGVAPPYNMNNSVVVYLSNPDSVDTMQILSPGAKITVKLATAVAAVSFVAENTNGLIAYKRTTLPTISTGLSSYFVNSSYVAPGPKFMLTAIGTEIDVNKAYADTSKVVSIALSQTKKTDGSAFEITPNLTAGGPVTNTSLRLSGSPAVLSGSFTLPNGKTYMPISSSLAGNDPETIVSEERKSTIFNVYTSSSSSPTVLGWSTSGNPLTYSLTTKPTFFSYASTGANQGYFNLIPLGVGDVNVTVNQFLLMSSDNAKMFGVSGTTITALPTPLNASGLYTVPISTLGGWSTAPATIAGRFYLKYQGPTPAAGTAPASLYFVNITTVSSTEGLAATFTCTDCSPANGSCMINTNPSSAGPIVGIYTERTNGTQLEIKPGNKISFSDPDYGFSDKMFSVSGNTIVFGSTSITFNPTTLETSSLIGYLGLQLSFSLSTPSPSSGGTSINKINPGTYTSGVSRFIINADRVSGSAILFGTTTTYTFTITYSPPNIASFLTSSSTVPIVFTFNNTTLTNRDNGTAYTLQV